MKVHRLILVRTAAQQIAAVEDTVSLEEALKIEGVFFSDLKPHVEKAMQAGDRWKFDLTVAGVRVHGSIVPAHARNRDAAIRIKQEARR